ncbi:MAG: hypothetical protein HKN44_08365, partial [Ilumatobacter sp.]|nr:hypothetical protein [Ilumatobacter sp.]
GACCFDDGTCGLADVVGGIDCTDAGGAYQGDDTICADVMCVQPGACCLGDGMCRQETEIGGAACAADGGVYRGDDTSCDDVVCPQPGACCFDDGGCELAAGVGGDDCTAAGGSYQGDDTTCEPTTCPQPGACCFDDGMCAQAAAIGGADCTAAGGVYQGDTTTCGGVSCPQPGACCLEDGTCRQETVIGGAACAADGGSYQGDDTDCDVVSCPTGACCFPDGSCQDLSIPACDDAGGTFQGADTSCEDASTEVIVFGVDDPRGVDSQLFTLNLTTGVLTLVGPVHADEDIEGMAKFGDDVIGLTGDGGQPHDLVDMNFTTGALTFVADLGAGGTEVKSMASDGSGTVWAFMRGQGVAILAADGSYTLEVPMGFDLEGLAASGDGATLWGVTRDGLLYEIDVATDTVTFLVDLDPLFVDTSFENLELFSADELAFFTHVGNDLEFNLYRISTGDITTTLYEDLNLEDVESFLFGIVPLCPQPEPTGACCIDLETCIDGLTQSECAGFGGTYQGNDSACEEIICFTPGESCCDLGDPRILSMYFTGDDCSATSHDQGGNATCDDFGIITDPAYILATDKEDPDDGGARVWFAGTVSVGDIYEIDAANAGENKLKSNTFIHIFDSEGGTQLQKVKIHTSCSEPLETGNQFGASLLVGCLGENEGPFPFMCDGKIVEMTMIWDGSEPVRVKAYDGRIGGPLLADIDNIAIGQEITIGPYTGPNDVFYEIFEAGTSTPLGMSKFHRSCSD